MHTLFIEWRHLVEADRTCNRCETTGHSLHRVIAQLNRECRESGWEILLKETALTKDSIDESNSILIDGLPLENILPGARKGDTHCRSCSELIGLPTRCRSIESTGEHYEAIPESLIRSAVCKVAACCC